MRTKKVLVHSDLLRAAVALGKNLNAAGVKRNRTILTVEPYGRGHSAALQLAVAHASSERVVHLLSGFRELLEQHEMERHFTHSVPLTAWRRLQHRHPVGVFAHTPEGELLLKKVSAGVPQGKSTSQGRSLNGRVAGKRKPVRFQRARLPRR
ncbi:MAG: hypothetical protein AABW54_03810 [Candidatus Micrarchaeota archaeon]